MERGSSSNEKHLNAIQYKEKKALENIASLRKLVYKSFLSQNAKKAFYEKINQLIEDLKADPMNIELQQQVEQLTEKVIQLQADIERRKQQREQDQKTISALREENAQLRRNNEKNASFNENLRKENRDLKRKEYSEKMNNEDFMAFRNGDLTTAQNGTKTRCENNSYFHTSLIFNWLRQNLYLNIHPR